MATKIEGGAATKAVETSGRKLMGGAAIPIAILTDDDPRPTVAGAALPLQILEAGVRPLMGGAALPVRIVEPTAGPVMAGAAVPAVIVQGHLVWLDGYGYRKELPITGEAGAGTNYQIKLRIASDWWHNWLQASDSPIITPTQPWEGDNIYSLTVLLEGTTYRGWWGGFDGTNDRIGYGWSADGETWNKHIGNPVLNIGAPGQWDDDHVNDPSVVKVGGTYYMLYTGTRVAFQDEIGLATAANPQGPWAKSGSNPVLPMGYDANEYYVARPTVIHENGTFRMWYDGRHQISGNITGIYYATSPDGVNWARQGQVIAGNYLDADVVRWDADTLVMTVKVPGDPAKVNLYESSDGVNWTLKASNIDFSTGWNQYGATGNGLVVSASGDLWQYYGGISTVDRLHQRIGLVKNVEDSGALHCVGHAKADFGDIRFTRADGLTEIDHWMQEKTNSDYAVFWIEIPGDLATNQIIYVYYGNPAATTASEGEATFLFFDDFPGLSLDLAKWDVISGSPSVTGSIVTIQADDIRTDDNWPIGKRLLSFAKHYVDDYFQDPLHMRDVGGGAAIDHLLVRRDSAQTEASYWITWTKAANLDTKHGHQNPLLNQFHVYEATWRSGEMKFYRKDALLDIHTTNVPSVNLRARLLSVGNNPQLDVDWIAIGKFVDPEPAAGTVGAEEED